MTLSLHNTFSGKKEVFSASGRLPGIYACGPTVYGAPHIGNVRSAVFVDILRRILEVDYGSVMHVRNLTDIDDKIIDRSRETGMSIGDITRNATGMYHNAMSALRIRCPTYEPRATEHIPEMQSMIGRLMFSGFAYESSGHVLFSAARGSGEGALTRQFSGRRAGARVTDGMNTWKREPADFILWKPAGSDEPGWDSPWGRGRPGWHIECSAMAARYLGDVFDIHAGGADLMAPHHENEISQSCAAHGTDIMARFWVHNGMLTVDGRKMSKSLGNILTVDDIVGNNLSRARTLRFLFLMTHYRAELDYTESRMREAAEILRKWDTAVSGFSAVGISLSADVMNLLHDDMNVPGAIALLHEKSGSRMHRNELYAAMQFLDILPDERSNISDEVQNLLLERKTAREAREWKKSDSIRDILLSVHGLIVEDTPEGQKTRTSG